ncbi:MAG: type IX secretion system protein PorQ [Bacteroidia bacterium]|nr:type IX secretion system protein PorQ [Bacteroidia bacterium]
MKNTVFLIIFFLAGLGNSCSLAQSGGNNTFEFLNLVAPARAAALGGNAIATRSDDITLTAQNPALYDPEMDQQVSLSYVAYLAGIRYGNVMLAKDFSAAGTFGFNLQYISYGEFEETSVTSEKTGSFSAGEYAFNVGWSKALDSGLYIGANVKYITSSFGDNHSNGLAADLGLNWSDREKFWSASLVLKNVGRQLKAYEGAEREKLPFEIQAGVARQLPKAPFRFSLIAQHLQTFDITYTDPSQAGIDPLTGESKSDKINTFDKVVRHLVFNVEILFSKNFNARLGYNFLRRNELGFPEKKGMSGMSLGLGFKVSKFNFSYAHSIFNTAAGSNHFTVTTNLKNFAGRD